MLKYPSSIFCFVLASTLTALGEDTNVHGLRRVSPESLSAMLPHETRLLVDPASIERWLKELDGHPPDWKAVYGGGHHDPDHDERLFALNRERDAKRDGNPTLSHVVTFVWLGELSPYDVRAGGFPVALGPKFTSTAWGVVRFKPEEVPSNLVVVADAMLRETLQGEIERLQHVEIEVAMTGRLIPEESLVYDFSHDEAGLGLIMPFVRVERVDFLLPKNNR